MSRSFTFDDLAASWLLATMQKAKRATLQDATRYNLEVAQTIHRIVDVMEAGGELVADTAPPAPPEGKTEKPKPRPRGKREKAIPRQNSCIDHTHYTAARAPRTDCQGCWNFYRHLQPTRYTLSRRKFELNQRRKQAQAG